MASPVRREVLADPLASAAQVAFAEELSSSMRHATRNKLAIIRNAATYIRRKVGQTEAWTADPRIEMFYGMLESELEDASDLLEPREFLTHVFVRNVRRVDAAASVQLALETARMGASVAVTSETAPGDVNADPRELALAVRCLVENAAEAGVSLAVRARPKDDTYLVEIVDMGRGASEAELEMMLQPFYTTKPDHVGLGLNMARRIAHRYGGALGLSAADRGGLVASLRVPLAKDGQP